MKPQHPTFKEALQFWLKLGFISFGGPAGQIAIMHEFVVDKKRWVSNSKFLHALNYCMLLPGPEAQQLATYLGWLLHGVRGGLAAGVLFVLPSAIMLLVLSVLYVNFGAMPAVAATFSGLKPAVVAVVLLALLKIGKKALLSPVHWFVAGLAFGALFFFNVPFPLVIVGAIVLGVFLVRAFPEMLKASPGKNEKPREAESAFLLNAETVLPHTGLNIKRLAKQIGIGFLLWALPFLLLFAFVPDFNFWATLCLFFTKAAFATFGGAYAVLPYVAQVSVEKFHWLTQSQMLDGLALGETTPGPLIMVLAFVGFLAGHGQFGNSITMGALGLGLTTFYTFLPSFLFIFAGAPIIERTQANPKIRSVLGLVTAAVVGVVLNLGLYFGRAVVFPPGEGFDFLALAWVLVSVLAMHRFGVGMLVWLAVSGVFGLVATFFPIG